MSQADEQVRTEHEGELTKKQPSRSLFSSNCARLLTAAEVGILGGGSPPSVVS
jgi:hypothetical protein